jgi:hypothetical protein
LAAQAPNKVCNHRSTTCPGISHSQPPALLALASFVNGEDDTTTKSCSSFIQGEDDTTIEPLSAAERDYGNDDDSYEPYP